jgi:carbon storage regulator
VDGTYGEVGTEIRCHRLLVSLGGEKSRAGRSRNGGSDCFGKDSEMLVLSRKVGESVEIGHGMVRVTVKRIRGNQVQLVFDAPREITVVRSELLSERKRSEKRVQTETEVEAQQGR